ncbi:hypothetical protein [Actinomycetospora sp. CA-084318]|uniref:hypothetical protein n=1 Tax=Actinomycetospora sp. CA-084318 TaxID=3239892 RepID=UPI003D98841D
MTALLGLSFVALVVLGGAASLSASLAFAMASADPSGGPLLRLLIFPAIVSWWIWLVLGIRQAYRAFATTGWDALGAGALGWGIFVGGGAATVAVFFGLARMEAALARRRSSRG